jgi:DNA polymerase-3 subunit epsilon
MKVACIDFETANRYAGSICAVGLAVIETGQFTQSRYWLVKPHESIGWFDWFNIRVHGIRPHDVSDAPQFDAVYQEILPMIDGAVLAAHNASFDITALRGALDRYGIPYPRLDYLCTYRVAAKVWPELPNHRLDTVAEYLGHRFMHHNALEDAVACGKALLAAMREMRADSERELMDGLGLLLGTLSEEGTTSCRAVPRTRSPRRNKELEL